LMIAMVGASRVVSSRLVASWIQGSGRFGSGPVLVQGRLGLALVAGGLSDLAIGPAERGPAAPANETGPPGRLNEAGVVNIGSAAACIGFISQPGTTPKTTTTQVPMMIGKAIGVSAGASRRVPGSRKNIALRTRT